MRKAYAQAEGLRPPEPLEVVSVRLMTPEAQLRWAALEHIVAERRRQAIGARAKRPTDARLRHLGRWRALNGGRRFYR